MRMIDADALGIGNANKGVFDKPSYADGWNSAIAIIEDAPTIDAVEVCRCKYCKHRTLAGKAPFMFFLCSHNNGLRENVKDNDFCSYGERKEAE